jgi:hypothetical protein
MKIDRSLAQEIGSAITSILMFDQPVATVVFRPYAAVNMGGGKVTSLALPVFRQQFGAPRDAHGRVVEVRAIVIRSAGSDAGHALFDVEFFEVPNKEAQHG